MNSTDFMAGAGIANPDVVNDPAFSNLFHGRYRFCNLLRFTNLVGSVTFTVAGFAICISTTCSGCLVVCITTFDAGYLTCVVTCDPGFLTFFETIFVAKTGVFESLNEF